MNSRRNIFSILAAAVFGMGAVGPLCAETIYVGGDNADYDSLAEAVEAACTGDTICIASGTWVVEATIVPGEKSITIEGNGFWQTFIDWQGPAEGAVFRLEGSEGSRCVFRSLNFVGVNGQVIRGEGADFSVEECWFVGCRSGWGSDDMASAGGTAVFSEDAAPIISRCVFLDCEALIGYGGAVLLRNCHAGSLVDGCYFLNNQAKGLAGALLIEDGRALVQNCEFNGNRSRYVGLGENAGDGGAIGLVSSRAVVVVECRFSGNRARRHGGGIYLEDGPYADPASLVLLVQNEFLSNRSDDGNGGAVGQADSRMANSNTLLSDNLFESNECRLRGGGVCLSGSPRLQFEVFRGNSAGLAGGGLHIANRETGVEAEDAVVGHCRFLENSARMGAAVATGDLAEGGLDEPVGEHVRFETCVFQGNQARDAGGACFSGPDTTVFFSQCSFEGNQGFPGGDVFDNGTTLARISSVGCQFGSNGGANFQGAWISGPGNSFVDQAPAQQIAWNLDVDQGLRYWSAGTGGPLVDFAGDIDALAFLPNGDFILSFSDKALVPGLVGGPDKMLVDDSDLIRYRPEGLGIAARGKAYFYFDGSDVGLTRNSQDVDALAVDEAGRLYLSTTGRARLGELGAVNNRTILRFTPTQMGADTGGAWERLLDGNDIGLKSPAEDIDGLDILPGDDRVALSLLVSVRGKFSVPEIPGSHFDPAIFRFDAVQLDDGVRGPEGTWSLYSSPWLDPVYPASGQVTCFEIVD